MKDVVTIETRLEINGKRETTPLVTMDAGQNATLTVGSVDHQFSLSLTPAQAEGPFRPVAITATSTLADDHWTLSATLYLRSDEPTTLTLTSTQNAPTETLTLRLRTPNSQSVPSSQVRP